MAKASPAITGFNGGEWGAQLIGRSDNERWKLACRRMLNNVPYAQGASSRRPGTRYLAPFHNHADRGRIIPFDFSDEQAFQLGFEDAKMKVLETTGPFLRPASAVTGIVSLTPFIVTLAGGHGVVAGDQLFFTGFNPTSELNNGFAIASFVAGNDITLSGVTSPAALALIGGETAARVYTIATPYSSASLPGLNYASSRDATYLLTGQLAPRLLQRFGNLDWRLGTLPFIDGPYLSVNDSATTLAPSKWGDAITPFAPGYAGAFADTNDVGSLAIYAFNPDPLNFWAPSARQTGNVGYDFGAARTILGYTLHIPTNNSVDDYDYKDAAPLTWYFQGSNDNVTWIVIDEQKEFIAYSGARTPYFELPEPVSYRYYRILVTSAQRNGNVKPRVAWLALMPALDHADAAITFTANTAVGINGGQGFLSTDVGRHLRVKCVDGYWRWLKISSVSTTLSVVAILQGDPLCTLAPVKEWRLGAFSDTTGWPTCGGFHEDRLWLAGAALYPDLITATQTGGYGASLSFSPTTPDGAVLATSGITATLNSRSIGKIVSLTSDARGLLVLTRKGPWILKPLNANEAIAPGKIDAKPIYARGSADLAPVHIDSQALYSPRGGEGLRELAFDYQRDGFASPSMNLYSPQIGSSPLKGLAFAAAPHSIVWGYREDGSLVGFTYNRDEAVLAWHPHAIGGTAVAVEDIATQASEDGSRDELWIIVRRTVNGQVRRYYEIMTPFWGERSTLDDAWFFDCALRYDGAETTEINGLWHLNGQTVGMLGNGGAFPPQQVVAGRVTFPVPVTSAVIGEMYDSELEPMPLEAGAADGTAQGKTKRINKLVLRLWSSLGGEIGPVGGPMDTIDWRNPLLPFGSPIPLFTGNRVLDFPGGEDRDGSIVLRQPGALGLPFNVLAIYPQVTTQDLVLGET